MARRKSKNNSINLLKGITGSKLAKLLVILAIVLAIPLTVFMSQKQQNLEQDAASICRARRGVCLDLNIYNCTISISGLCPGGSNIRCCTGNYYRKTTTATPTPITTTKPTTTTTTKTNCSGVNGVCLDLNIYNCTISVSGLCPGGSNIRCCTGNYYRKTTTATPTPITTTKNCSRCSTTYKYCMAYWKEGDSNCDRSNVIGATTYKRYYSCTSGIDRGYCP